ncbi:probable N6-adenosine-methyltransferase MT-A70-like [Lolium rigidum]|uniref:probable N6-adenosine-methyltransferase MT-A70-like n=1 Tax=Lolium rigidum TaxID=89674 RepID=UPI001F5CD597|nr:probable N6-adenosine-methyltransferase MT-A70-like [Lolium rigidum]
MGTKADAAPGGGDDLAAMREQCRSMEEAITFRRDAQLALVGSLQRLVPDLVPTLDRSLRLVAAFNARPFAPTPNPNAADPQNPSSNLKPHHRRAAPDPARSTRRKTSPGSSPASSAPAPGGLDAVRTMVAVFLLELVPFAETDAAVLARRLQADTSSASDAERAALADLATELGGSVPAAVALALRRIAEDSGGVQIEEAMIGGKQMMMVWAIDRTKLLKELPESTTLLPPQPPPAPQPTSSETDTSTAIVPRPPPQQQQQQQQQQQDMWAHSMPPMFPRPRGMPMPGMQRMMPGLMRPFMAPSGVISMGPASGPMPTQQNQRTEEEDLKDLEVLLSKKTYKEKQNTKTGEELLDLIHRPTAKETAVAAKFKTKGGSQLKEYCTNLTKEDCRRQSGSFVSCAKVHFRRIIAPHTDTNLGDCSFLDTCRHTKTCKYVHYELDQTPDIAPMMAGALAPPRQIKPHRAEYCSEIELGESQWINCDIRNFRMDILGQFGVIMADPPWDIHMELPYGTMADDEMRTLNVPALQTDGLIFLWVTGRAMELGRECLELWGYKRVEEIIWVKTNQLQRIIRTGRTGHWLNHSKEHCLVGIKGSPLVNRNIDTDVIVAEVRETSRKPDEMYAMLERISPRTRKLELFARMHNTQSGWLSLGNQVSGTRLVDEGLRARYKAAYPDFEVQPPSPPRASAPTDADQNTPSQKPAVSDGERPT